MRGALVRLGCLPSLLLVTAFCGCASVSGDTEKVPLCGPLQTLAPLPDHCEPGELDAFTEALSREIPPSSRAVVRVSLDDTSKVRGVCVGPGPKSGSWSSSWTARNGVAQNLDPILALPPGPACAAGKRLDLNRYGAKLAEIQDREARCQQQVEISAQNQTTTVGNQLYAREFEQCMRYQADWIVLGGVIYVKPEIPNPPGPSASDTASRCTRKSWGFDETAECIESDGWERLK